MEARKSKSASTNGANLGFEVTLWQSADNLRNNMDAASPPPRENRTIGGSEDAFATKHANAFPFDEFVARVDIRFGHIANSDAFRVQGLFALGGASNGINPVTEVVTLQLGTFSVTIPAGSFGVTNSGPLGKF